MSNSSGRANFSNTGNTGAPCEGGQVCQSCHLGGFYAPVTEDFRLIDPLTQLVVSEYIPGKLYNVEIEIMASGFPSAYGFQATVLDTNHVVAGSWTNIPSNIQISEANVSCGEGNRKYIEHTTPFFLSTFQLDWQAPTCNIGPITFYYIGNAVNNDMSTSGDTGGTGNSTTFNGFLPQTLVLDSTEIPGGYYLAQEYVSITGAFQDSALVVLGTLDSILFYQETEVLQGVDLSIFMENCLE